MTIITGPLAALKLVQIAAYDATLDDAAKRTLAMISGYADLEGTCWPSIKKMSANQGITRQAVINQINILIKHNYVSRKERYNPASGGRRSNLYTLNIRLANEYHDNPEIFCKRNVTTVVTYLVTLLYYRGMDSKKLHADVTQLGDINITNITNQEKHNIEYTKVMKRIEKQKILQSNSWQDQKERDLKDGITASHRKKMEDLSKQMKNYKSLGDLARYDLNLAKKVRALNLSPLNSLEYMIRTVEKDIEAEQAKSKQS